MASFADALMQGMISQMDPNVAMQRDAMASFLEVQKGKVQVEKGLSVGQLVQQLTALKTAGFDDSSVPVVAINRLINSLSE